MSLLLGARRQTIVSSVLESLRLYRPHFTLASVLAEVQHWTKAGRSCFVALLEKLDLTVAPLSILDQFYPSPDGYHHVPLSRHQRTIRPTSLKEVHLASHAFTCAQNCQLRHVLIPCGPNHEMPMVGNQAIGQETGRMLGQGLDQHPLESAIVFILLEEWQACHGPIKGVIHKTTRGGASMTRHAKIISRLSPPETVRVPPFFPFFSLHFIKESECQVWQEGS
jgi:hypothetical protein